ncbi:MAG TPA: hypothetical protein VMU49_08340 [Candidatus Acidoferrales bacterium]|nr:hypothetical protein [Candidatus Acidoferrales bacterium]
MVVPAAEAGVEGVACVDDAARAFGLLCDLFVITRDTRVRAWAAGLLEFLLWMHDGGGLWTNFIYDWTGRRNGDGRTSAPGVNFWQARALNAMAKAWVVFGDKRARVALDLGLEVAFESEAPSDVRSLQMTALMQLIMEEPTRDRRRRLGAWSDEVAQCELGGVLMNSADERGAPHLWGHIQEGVLADAGTVLEREDLVKVAERSADRVFAELIDSGFRAPLVQPYGVQSAVFGMDRLAAATGRSEYYRLARLARLWFDGRNPPGRAVYDRDSGRVADGIDELRISLRSGAESNISAGLALFPDIVLLVSTQPPGERLFSFLLLA